MVYVLITVGAFISIITTSIFKSVKDSSKYRKTKKAAIVIISFLVFITFCFFLLNQKGYQ